MARLIPKTVDDTSWRPLVQHRDYAVMCKPADIVYFKFGAGHGLVLSIDPAGTARTINTVDLESGEPSLVSKLSSESKNVLGRTSECTIKIMHAIVSRQHLEITLKPNILIVRDLGSTNGSYIFADI